MTNLVSLAGGLFRDLDMGASIGGIPFEIKSLATADGRRVHWHNLPGQDAVNFSDLGQYNGPMEIEGLLVGDGVTWIAEGFRRMARSRGTKILDVPFLIESVEVVILPTPKIVMKGDQLRIADISFTCMRFEPPEAGILDTLQGILDAIQAVRSAIRRALNLVLGPLALGLAAIGFVQGLVAQAQDIWTGLAGAVSDPQIAAAVAGPVAALSAAPAVPAGPGAGDAIVDLLAAPSAAVVGTSIPVVAAAVGAGGPASATVPADGRVTAGLLIDAAALLAPVDPVAPGAAVALAAQVLALADAVDAASDIDFESQQEALAWKARVGAALAAGMALAAWAAAARPVEFGPVWRALSALDMAFAADMTATIGRLPPVKIFTPRDRMPVWLLAHHLAGDDPGRMVAVYRDLVARNRIATPWAAPAGPLEVLL